MTKQVYWAVLLERNPIGVCASTVMNLAARAAQLGYTRIEIPYGRTDVTRNLICAKFLELSSNPTDTLIMLDDDHAHDINTLQRLVDDDLMIVGALAQRRGPPYDAIAFVADKNNEYHSMAEWEPGQIYECNLVSPAAIAIQRRAFIHLEAEGYTRPWFRYTYTDGKLDAPTEDMWFADICRKAGIKHAVDTAVVAPHYHDGWITPESYYDYKKDHPEIAPRPESTQPKVSVIIPTRKRHDALRRSLGTLKATAPGAEIVVVNDDDDHISEIIAVELGADVWTNRDSSLTGIPKWNMGIAYADADWLVTGADDVIWHDGWLDAALKTENKGFIGLNDMHTPQDQYCTHYMVTRQFAKEHLGGVLQIPAYKSWYSDVEVCVRAKQAGAYVYAPDAIVEHVHPQDGKTPTDEIYERGAKYQAEDLVTFSYRMRAGFPNDYEAVLK